MRAKDSGSGRFRGGAHGGGKRRPDLDRRGDERGQERRDTRGGQRLGDGSDRPGSRSSVLAGEPVDLEVDESGGDDLAWFRNDLFIGTLRRAAASHPGNRVPIQQQSVGITVAMDLAAQQDPQGRRTPSRAILRSPPALSNRS